MPNSNAFPKSKLKHIYIIFSESENVHYSKSHGNHIIMAAQNMARPCEGQQVFASLFLKYHVKKFSKKCGMRHTYKKKKQYHPFCPCFDFLCPPINLSTGAINSSLEFQTKPNPKNRARKRVFDMD